VIHVRAPEGYEVVRPLGKGETGSVFLAKRVEDGTLFALKYLDLPVGELRERFLREGRIACQLRHPNIVAGHAIEFAGETPVLVFEYVDGVDVATMSELEGRMPPERAVGLVRQALAGLQCAHDATIVHRDVKPANLIVAIDGTLKVADFGTARLRETHERMTRTGALIGTPAYMAPEQAAGEHVDHRADVYAAGVVLFELLARELPITGATPVELLGKIATQPARRLDEVVPGAPAWLADVLARCLAKRPEERFPTASALEHALAAGPDGASARRAPTVKKLAALAPLAVTIDASLPPTIEARVQLPADWREESARARTLSSVRAHAPWLLIAFGALLALAVLFAPGGPARPHASAAAVPLGVKNALGGAFIERDGDRLVFAFELERPLDLKATLRAGWSVQLERTGPPGATKRPAFIAPAQLVLRPFVVVLERADGVPVTGNVVEHGGLVSALEARVRVPPGEERSWLSWFTALARDADPALVPRVAELARAFPPTPQGLEHARTTVRLLAGHARTRLRVLMAAAGPVLDAPHEDMKDRRAAYEALLPLRLLDRAAIALKMTEPLLGAEQALGLLFGTQRHAIDDKLRRTVAKSDHPIGAVVCPEGYKSAFLRNLIVESINKVPRAEVELHRTAELAVDFSSRNGAPQRNARIDVVFNIVHGADHAIYEDDLIWVKANGWPLLIHRGCWSPNDGVRTEDDWVHLMHRVDPELLGTRASFELTRDVVPAPPQAKKAGLTPPNRKVEITVIHQVFVRGLD
jgi:hypothetical protein